MMSENSGFLRSFGGFRRDRSGVTAFIVALTFTGVMGLSALVIDMGTVFVARRALQTSADSAALSGAADINASVAGTAITTAKTYSALAGKYNASSTQTVTMPNGYPVLKCLTSIGVSCVGSDNSNAIVVQQTTSVPTVFARLFGISQIAITATSTASLAPGTATPTDFMLVLDTTASMKTADSNCAGQTKMNCALSGARGILNGLAPSAMQVGVMAFPGATTAAEAAKNYNCSTDTPAVAKYSANPVYSVLPLGNDFKTNNNSTALNTNSNAVIAFKGGCSNGGMVAVGGVGTYFADAITAAQAALTANGRVGAQKVILLLSDGDAGASSSNISAAKLANQCKQAVTAAKAAKDAGTIIYAMAYDAQTSGTCSSDTVKTSGCATMQAIATDASSDPNKSTFLSSDGGSGTCPSVGNPTTNLTQAFGRFTLKFSGTRLLPNNTI